MSAADRLATEHRERLERFRQHAERVRETEVSRIAIDILGVRPDDVARALRGNLTQDDEDGAQPDPLTAAAAFRATGSAGRSPTAGGSKSEE